MKNTTYFPPTARSAYAPRALPARIALPLALPSPIPPTHALHFPPWPSSQYLRGRLKVDGKVGNLGDNVRIASNKTSVSVTSGASPAPASARLVPASRPHLGRLPAARKAPLPTPTDHVDVHRTRDSSPHIAVPPLPFPQSSPSRRSTSSTSPRSS